MDSLELRYIELAKIIGVDDHSQIKIIASDSGVSAVRPKRRITTAFFKCYIADDSGCWIWQMSRYPQGYGAYSFKNAPNRTYQAHRVAWLLFHRRPIPNGMLVCHTCDNPPCVNPEHLFLGTTLDNVRDKMRKGRYRCPKGEEHYGAKLTVDDVVFVRAAYTGKFGEIHALALRFGVSDRAISAVLNRLNWKSV